MTHPLASDLRPWDKKEVACCRFLKCVHFEFMSLFQRLFSGANSVESSPVRRYFNEEIRRLERGSLNIEQQFSISILGCVAEFGMRNNKPIDELSKVVNDTTLFELASFALAKADLYLRKQPREIRSELLRLLYFRMKDAFHSLIPDSESLGAVINDRLMMYRSLFARSNDNAAPDHLCHILQRTTSSSVPAMDESMAADFSILNAYASVTNLSKNPVSIELIKWEHVFLDERWTSVLDQASAMLSD